MYRSIHIQMCLLILVMLSPRMAGAQSAPDTPTTPTALESIIYTCLNHDPAHTCASDALATCGQPDCTWIDAPTGDLLRRVAETARAMAGDPGMADTYSFTPGTEPGPRSNWLPADLYLALGDSRYPGYESGLPIVNADLYRNFKNLGFQEIDAAHAPAGAIVVWPGHIGVLLSEPGEQYREILHASGSRGGALRKSLPRFIFPDDPAPVYLVPNPGFQVPDGNRAIVGGQTVVFGATGEERASLKKLKASR